MSSYAKLKLVQIFNHIMMVVGIWYMADTGEWSWMLVSCLFFILTHVFGVVCGYHRLLSHKSFKTSRFWEVFLTICGTYTAMGSSITWVGVHRVHHTNADRQSDPHSPYSNRDQGQVPKFSLVMAFKGWMNIWNIDSLPPRYVIDLIRDPVHRFLHTHYFKILTLTFIFTALVNPLYAIFALSIPACMAFHSTGSLITIAHYHGYRTHNTKDKSTNSWLSNILTFGDGWHNNHHANPGRWTTQEKWWEIDPSGWIIRLIKKD